MWPFKDSCMTPIPLLTTWLGLLYDGQAGSHNYGIPTTRGSTCKRKQSSLPPPTLKKKTAQRPGGMSSSEKYLLEVCSGPANEALAKLSVLRGWPHQRRSRSALGGHGTNALAAAPMQSFLVIFSDRAKDPAGHPAAGHLRRVAADGRYSLRHRRRGHDLPERGRSPMFRSTRSSRAAEKLQKMVQTGRRRCATATRSEVPHPGHRPGRHRGPRGRARSSRRTCACSPPRISSSASRP